MSVSNSIWIRDSFEPFIRDEFKNSLKTYFRSEIMPRKFSDSRLVGEINAWVKGKTQGKIDKIMDYIDRETVLFIINAIYFKGDWVEKFEESKTRLRNFYLQNSGKTLVPMMEQGSEFLYFSDKSVEVIRLPYGKNKIAMYVFLPEEGTGVDSFIQGLEEEKLGGLISNMDMSEIELQIPKLKLAYGNKELNNALSRLGMGVAFDENLANLKGIASLSSANLWISFIDHKAVVEINEKGTEAAAVTSIGPMASPIQFGTRRFTANRPYFFVIRDDRSGSILFMGKILDPTQLPPQ